MLKLQSNPQLQAQEDDKLFAATTNLKAYTKTRPLLKTFCKTFLGKAARFWFVWFCFVCVVAFLWFCFGFVFLPSFPRSLINVCSLLNQLLFLDPWSYLLSFRTRHTKEINSDNVDNPSLVTRAHESSRGLDCLWIENLERGRTDTCTITDDGGYR